MHKKQAEDVKLIDIHREKSYYIEDLLQIMKILRGESGCPWDAEQDHHSIRNNFIEETYEVADAIDRDDTEALKEELGDVLLQVVFHAQMEEEKGTFSFSDVTDGICRKLIERHPHVFGDVKVSSTDDVLNNWDKIKQSSKKQTTASQTLRAVPGCLPALMRSQKVVSRAMKAGASPADDGEALADVNDRMDRLCLAVCGDKEVDAANAIGDLLLSVTALSKKLGIDAEEALYRSTERYIDDFEKTKINL